MVNVTGTLIWYYYICQREVWLMSHQIEPQQDNNFIEIGRIISQDSYLRDDKELNFGNIRVDLISYNDKKVIISEVKKSSHFIKSSQMQLAFYLLELKEKGIKNLTGELRFPKEKKKVKIILTNELEKELKIAINEITKLVLLDIPPFPCKNNYCKSCGYYELCWV